MIINHNMMAVNANRMANINSNNASKAMAKLSSGLRINSAADDAAGLAISEKMKGQINGLNQASSNAQDGVSMVQSADGALTETTSVLQRMRELAVQSSNDTNTSTDRADIQKEVDQLAQQITNISNTTEFNTQNLLAGGLNSTLQIGSNSGQTMTIQISAMDAKTLGVSRDLNEVSAMTAGSTTLSTSAVANDDLGSGLTAQTYKLAITHTAATVSGLTKTVAGAVTDGGAYTGSTTQTNVQFRVDALNGSGALTAASYSTDAGNTWSAASVSGGVITYDGETLTVAATTTNAVNQTITATFNAARDSIQLKDSTGAPIGSAVTATAANKSVTVGDATTGRTMTIHSGSFGGLTTGATTGVATVTVATQASSAAVRAADGTITEAVTKAGIDVSTQAAAESAITLIDAATQTVSSQRAVLGAYQNRLESTINNLGTTSQNLTSAQSQIADVDMAAEMAEYSKDNVLSQAAQAMLAQANQQSQQVLQLLR